MSKQKTSSFHDRVKKLIQKIPRGKVATYGQIAALAGNPRGARQVAWVLHSSSDSAKLPWQRVINSQGTISLPRMEGYEVQRALLEKEGVRFGLRDEIDLTRFQWRPRTLRTRRGKS